VVHGCVHTSSRGTVLIANPSADVYGSDLQMKESVAGLVDRGWRVVVAAPSEGPLVRALLDLGAEVRLLEFPVLRRSAASPRGLAALTLASARALPRMRSLLREERPAIVYVNTVTLPWWLLAGRLAGIPTLCHVHEAEAADPPAVRKALTLPLLLADTVVVNSRSTEKVVLGSVPRLRARTRLVHNGVDGPSSPLAAPPRVRLTGVPWQLAVVGRLSARKAPDTALEAVALLRGRGHDVQVGLYGTPGPGQEEYVAGLHARAAQPDLRGAVRFGGYCAPIWAALEAADVLVAPSLGESFGNAVVEAQLARRPVVATAVQGHCETVTDGETGLLVPPQDPWALADILEELLDDAERADRLADAGQRSAMKRFGSDRYRSDIEAVVTELAGLSAGQARPASSTL
jgi:glycosyltransferase involved in cell wall biosynthesis